LFRAIKPKECLNQAWSKNKQESPNILAMIVFFNTFSGFVSTYVVSQVSLRDRVNTIKFFIKLALDCKHQNNYEAVRSILAGLALNPVYRLKKSWIKVKSDKKAWDDYTELQYLISHNKSYANLRAQISNVAPPCLPCLGVYLQDLTFLEDGNPDYLNVEGGEKDVLNIEKMRKVATVIKSIILYQHQIYNFTKVDVIYNFFMKLPVLSDDEQWTKSREVEPKEEVEAAEKKEKKRRGETD